MKKFIIASLTVMLTHTILYSQDTTTKLKSKKTTPYVLTGGRYIVTIDDGKVTTKKNPNFDESKVIKRELPRGNFSQRFEVFVAGSDTPIIKKYFIDDLKSESSIVTFTRAERIAKYGSREPVEIVYLKPGIIPLTMAELLQKFKVAKENANLAVYRDFKPIAKPDNLMGVADAIAKIEIVTDGDGVRFLNIVTKDWMSFHEKHPNVVYIK